MDILTIARRSHYNRTKHADIMVGLNFIECMICHKHAHENSTQCDGLLYEHDTGYHFCNPIKPEDF